jgi:hypothetical protein
MKPRSIGTAAVALALALAGAPRGASAQVPPDAREEKSGGVATGLAIGGTLGGFAMMVVGANAEAESLAWVGLGVTTVGPSAGHLYAGESGHALATTAIRAGAIAIFAVGFDMSFCLFDCEDRDVEERRNGELLAFGGLGLFAAATVYDIVDAHQAARRANRRAAATPVPVVLTSPDGHRAPGLVLTGRF